MESEANVDDLLAARSVYKEPPVYWYCIACKFFCTPEDPCPHCASEHTHR